MLKGCAFVVACATFAVQGASGFSVDGAIGDAEWAAAESRFGLCPRNSQEQFPAEAEALAARDSGRLYVAVRSAIPASGLLRRVMPNRQGAYAYIDDTVTLALPGRRGLVVNANGAVTATGWEPRDLKCASTVTNGFWNFEMSLPLSEVGEVDKFDVGRRWATADKAYGRTTSALFDMASVSSASPRVRMLGIASANAAYTVRMRVHNPSGKAAEVKVEVSGRPENSQPAVLRKSIALAPGASEEIELKGPILDDEKVVLSVAATVGGKRIFSRTTTVRPNFSGSPFARSGSDADRVSYKFAYYPSHNRLRTRVDVSRVPAFASVVKGVVVALSDAKGREVVRRMVAVDKTGMADETFPVPDLRPLTVASGNPEYTLRMSVEGLNGAAYEKRLYRYAMEWEGNKYGLSDAVVPPFEAIKVEKSGLFGGGMKVRTVLHEHEMTGVGLFRQVKCPANEGGREPTTPILEGGMKLVATVGGRETEIRGSLEAEASESPVLRRFRAKFDERGFAGRVDAAFEYDGHLDWHLVMERGRVDALKLVIPVKAKEATHLHACVDGLRHNFGGRVPAGTGTVWNGSLANGRRGILGDYLPYIWVGGTLRGISVYGENDRGWVHHEGWPAKDPKDAPVHCQEIVRGADGTVSIVLNLVQRPFEVKEPREIRIGFMATPVKPMLDSWRAVDWGHFLGSGLQWGAGPQDANVEPWDGTDEFWRRMAQVRDACNGRDNPKLYKEYVDYVMAHIPMPGKPGDHVYEVRHEKLLRHYMSGFANCARVARARPMTWYTNARGVNFGIPSGTTFCDEWSRWEFMDMDRDFDCMSKRDYDLDPNAAFRDYAAWWYRKATLARACDSYYWDDIYLQSNFDLVGTEAYRLPDGRIQPATGVNNMRGLVKRCATVQAECGGNPTNNWIHMTDTAIAPISAFAGVHFDMEDSPTNGDAFQKKYPMDYLEAVSIGRQMGCRVKVIAHYPKTTAEKDAWYERTGAGMCLCYEFGWKWNANVYNAVHGKMCEWGYRTPAVRVWNYWNRDEAYPLALKGPAAASIAMAKAGTGEALFAVNDFSGKGGEVRVRPDAKALGLKPGWRAFDFEQLGEAEVPSDGGEVAVQVKPYDFRVVLLKGGK